MDILKTDHVYNIYRQMKKFLEAINSKKLFNMFNEHTFEYIARNEIYITPNWEKGVVGFVDLTNHINSGLIDLNVFCSVFLIEAVISDKPLNTKILNSVDEMKKIFTFYSVLETRKQLSYINTLTEQQQKDNPFEIVSDQTNEIYKVNQAQKNTLYELVLNRKINAYAFLFCWINHKFEIDEKKIDDPKYKKFIQVLQIIRQNQKSKKGK